MKWPFLNRYEISYPNIIGASYLCIMTKQITEQQGYTNLSPCPLLVAFAKE